MPGGCVTIWCHSKKSCHTRRLCHVTFRGHVMLYSEVISCDVGHKSWQDVTNLDKTFMLEHSIDVPLSITGSQTTGVKIIHRGPLIHTGPLSIWSHLSTEIRCGSLMTAVYHMWTHRSDVVCGTLDTVQQLCHQTSAPWREEAFATETYQMGSGVCWPAYKYSRRCHLGLPTSTVGGVTLACLQVQ